MMKRVIVAMFVAAAFLVVLAAPVGATCSGSLTCNNASYSSCVSGAKLEWKAERHYCDAPYQYCVDQCRHDTTLSPGEEIQCEGFCHDEFNDCAAAADADLCWNLDDCEVSWCYYYYTSTTGATAKSDAIVPRGHGVRMDALTIALRNIELSRRRHKSPQTGK